MPLRLWQQILIFSGLIVSLTLAAMLWFVSQRVQEAAVLQAGQQLERAARAVDVLADSRFERRRGALQEWAASWRVERAAGASVPLVNLPLDGQAFALVLAPDGAVRVLEGRPPLIAADRLPHTQPIPAALDGQARRGLWSFDGRLVEVLAVPLPSRYGGESSAIVLGEEVADVVEPIQAVTGAEVLILAGDQLVETTLREELVPAALDLLRRTATGSRPEIVDLGGQRFLMGFHDVGTDFGGRVCRHVILQPLQAVLEPSREAIREILLLALGALGLVVAATAAGLRTVSRPLTRLTEVLAGMAKTGSLRADFPACGGGYEVMALERTFRQLALSLSRAEAERELSYREAVAAVVAALDARDHGTYGHSLRVAAYARLLAERVALPPEKLTGLEWGALLHDVGKIAVPDAILQKPGKLEPIEWEVMKRHTEWGRSIVSRVAFLRIALPVVEHHHERWDGSGYPAALRGTEIPIEARIFAVVDAYDAMMSPRPYRPGRPHELAVAELERVSGTQLDPALVEAFLSLEPEVLARVREIHDISESSFIFGAESGCSPNGKIPGLRLTHSKQRRVTLTSTL